MKQFYQDSSNPSRRGMARFPLLVGLSLFAVTAAFGAYLYKSSRPVSAADKREQRTTVAQKPDTNAYEGPVRMARVVELAGDVDFRVEPQGKWAALARNMPLREGAQLAVMNNGRTEIQFDDGSRARFGANAVTTLQTLFSDPKGEYTEINLTDGPAAFYLTNPHSIYQINTPAVSVKAAGPARFRIDSGGRTRVAVHQGSVNVEGPAGQAQLLAGQYLDIRDANATYRIASIPTADGFDNWTRQRDGKVAKYQTRSRTYKALPSNIALMADDLDEYGTWRQHREYGDVWYPRVDDDWRPYEDGRWVWQEPFGYTWVADEPWGWAPSHYGTWMREPRGWGWVPGPRHQAWSPGVVAFSECGNRIGWSPVSPYEMDYSPLLALASGIGGDGIGGSDLGGLLGLFAIAQAAGIFPDDRDRFVPVPYGSRYVNRDWYDRDPYYDPYYSDVYYDDVYYDDDYYDPYYDRYYDPYYDDSIYRNYYYRPRVVNHNRWRRGNRFVPLNARAGCVMLVDADAFGRTDRFRRLPRQDCERFFTQGYLVEAPERGHPVVCGPRTARWTPVSLTPRRAFRDRARVARASLERPIHRAVIRDDIARASRIPIRTLTGLQVVERDGVRTLDRRERDRRDRDRRLLTERRRAANVRAAEKARARRISRAQSAAERARESLRPDDRRKSNVRDVRGQDRDRRIVTRDPKVRQIDQATVRHRENARRRAAQDRRVAAIRSDRANEVARNREAHRAVAARQRERDAERRLAQTRRPVKDDRAAKVKRQAQVDRRIKEQRKVSPTVRSRRDTTQPRRLVTRERDRIHSRSDDRGKVARRNAQRAAEVRRADQRRQVVERRADRREQPRGRSDVRRPIQQEERRAARLERRVPPAVREQRMERRQAEERRQVARGRNIDPNRGIERRQEVRPERRIERRQEVRPERRVERPNRGRGFGEGPSTDVRPAQRSEQPRMRNPDPQPARQDRPNRDRQDRDKKDRDKPGGRNPF